MVKQKRKVYYIEQSLIDKIKARAVKVNKTESVIIRELIRVMK